MRLLLSSLFVAVVAASCIQHTTQEEQESGKFRPQKQIEIKYAEGFEVEYTADYTKIVTHSIQNNEFFRDSVYIQHTSSAKLDGLKKIPFTLSSVASQSTTHLAFLDCLHELETVKGLCGVKYIRNDSVSSILEKNEIKELCLTESVQIESLLDCNPELFFNYPFGKTEQKGFAENGVQTLYIAEYLEQTQLARLEWIKLFGLLFNKVEEANAYFERVEDNYLSLRQKSQSTNKKFIMNLPFGDSWFMPSSKSVGVEVIRDAGLDYYYQREEGTENQIHTQEQVWNDGIYADYWVIIADRPVGYGLEDLLAEREVYAEFKAVKEQQVIMCNIAEVDYFASGVVEPDVLLRDMLFHTHQISDHQPKYFFRLE